MEKKWIIIGIVGVVLVVLSFVFSPSEKMAEEMTENYIENAIEKEMDGAVDIDVNDNSFKMETKDGSYQSGDNVTLPDNFPSDVYVYEGKILAVFENNDTSTMVSIETDAKPSDVKEVYIEKMKEAATYLLGTHDFSSFRNSGCQSLTPIRTIIDIQIISSKRNSNLNEYSLMVINTKY
jgi:tRNA U38,U39,U40 pseudouridine synthase TruA